MKRLALVALLLVTAVVASPTPADASGSSSTASAGMVAMKGGWVLDTWGYSGGGIGLDNSVIESHGALTVKGSTLRIKIDADERDRCGLIEFRDDVRIDVEVKNTNAEEPDSPTATIADHQEDNSGISKIYNANGDEIGFYRFTWSNPSDESDVIYGSAGDSTHTVQHLMMGITEPDGSAQISITATRR